MDLSILIKFLGKLCFSSEMVNHILSWLYCKTSADRKSRNRKREREREREKERDKRERKREISERGCNAEIIQEKETHIINDYILFRKQSYSSKDVCVCLCCKYPNNKQS